MNSGLRDALYTPRILYEGKTFTELADGVGYAEQVGFETVSARGLLAADSLPNGIVYAGFSLGVLPAQMLAQTRPGTKGTLLFHSCVPTSEFGRPWPQGVPLQINMMDADEWALPPNEDLDVAPASSPDKREHRAVPVPRDRHLLPPTACPITTKAPRLCSSNACSASSITSTSG